MKIGFFIMFNKGSLLRTGNVLGDELLAESMCRALLNIDGVSSCDVYAPNSLPVAKMDVMVYLNETVPNPDWARKHVVYIQNAHPKGSDIFLAKCRETSYDGYVFVSNLLLSKHKANGFDGIYLPFGVDTSLFYPRGPEHRYSFDVSYVGNDIKGKKRTMKYIYPATEFNFGLYGHWGFPHRLKFLSYHYQRLFNTISNGRIPQEDLPVLYSSSKINLNCTAQDCVDWDVITLRTFEVMACKGFLITDKVSLAEDELKDCVIFTDGGMDLNEKIKYYLAHPEERERVAQNGYEYAKKHVSSQARMCELFDYLGSIA